MGCSSVVGRKLHSINTPGMLLQSVWWTVCFSVHKLPDKCHSDNGHRTATERTLRKANSGWITWVNNTADKANQWLCSYFFTRREWLVFIQGSRQVTRHHGPPLCSGERESAWQWRRGRAEEWKRCPPLCLILGREAIIREDMASPFNVKIISRRHEGNL